MPIGSDRFLFIGDSHVGGNKKPHFGEILFITVNALVCGGSSFFQMVECAHSHEKWLRKWIGLPNGIPVKQTVINLFSLMGSQKFGQCFVLSNSRDATPNWPGSSSPSMDAMGARTAIARKIRHEEAG